jgi:hypothetical protein
MDKKATTKSRLRHSWAAKVEAGTMREEDWPLSKKEYTKLDNKGKLDLYMMFSHSLADPTHCKKVFCNAL